MSLMPSDPQMGVELEKCRTELASTKEELATKTKQVEDAKVAVAGYLRELERVAKATQEMLKQVAGIQKSGDMVRARLGKVQRALKAANDYIFILVGQEGMPKTPISEQARAHAREEYNEAQRQLATTDAVGIADLEALKALLNKAHIEFNVIEESGASSLYVKRGYSMFFTRFEFDSSGTLTDMGAWE